MLCLLFLLFVFADTYSESWERVGFLGGLHIAYYLITNMQNQH